MSETGERRCSLGSAWRRRRRNDLGSTCAGEASARNGQSDRMMKIFRIVQDDINNAAFIFVLEILQRSGMNAMVPENPCDFEDDGVIGRKRIHKKRINYAVQIFLSCQVHHGQVES